MNKLEHLLAKLSSYGSIAVALSGGVDSALLAMATSRALGNKAVAVTLVSIFTPKQDVIDAEKVAGLAGIKYITLDFNDLETDEVIMNDSQRCYYCKKKRFEYLSRWAKKNGYNFVAEGSNIDDDNDYRPGMRAIEEMSPHVVSPLKETGWNKIDIRKQAKEWKIPIYDKPSSACLASRIAYGIELTTERLEQVRLAEEMMRRYLSGQIRVRHHGNIARIEIDYDNIDGFFSIRNDVVREFKKLGFTYVTLDLDGYRMGSQNEIIGQK